MADYSTHSNWHSQKGQAQATGATGKNYVDNQVEQVDRSPVGGPTFVDLELTVPVSKTDVLGNVQSTTLVVVV